MDEFKIDNLKRSKPGQNFPWFRSLEPQETQKIRQAIRAKSGIETQDSLALVTELFGMSTAVEGLNADDEGFDLAAAVSHVRIQPGRHVYVNWYRFDRIDCMSFEDLARYFEDVWYPSSDDIDIFDDTLCWIIFIEHFGAVRLLRLGSESDHRSQ
jgi:hypothetical protein